MNSTELNAAMEKALEHLKTEFAGLRTGRAHPGLVDTVEVDYYGAPTPLKSLATVSVNDARTLSISPFDASAVKAIEKALLAANLGVTPNVDGKVIRITVPELTGERRKEMSKYASKLAEETKVALRNIRRDANDAWQKAEKAGDITEDDLKQELDQVQKTTDKFIAEVDLLTKEKVAEIEKV